MLFVIVVAAASDGLRTDMEMAEDARQDALSMSGANIKKAARHLLAEHLETAAGKEGMGIPSDMGTGAVPSSKPGGCLGESGSHAWPHPPIISDLPAACNVDGVKRFCCSEKGDCSRFSEEILRAGVLMCSAIASHYVKPRDSKKKVQPSRALPGKKLAIGSNWGSLGQLGS